MEAMSLLKKIRTRIHESREKGKQQKEERKVIDREAQAQAHKEYLESYRTERMSRARSNARARGRSDASEHKSRFGSVAGAGKTGFNMFSNAGQNLIKSGQLDIDTGNMDLGFGMSRKSDKKSKKKKKQKPSNMFDLF
jgi:hypothetical protein